MRGALIGILWRVLDIVYGGSLVRGFVSLQVRFVKPSSHSDSLYFCTVCQKDESIKHQGALDMQRHAEGNIHKQKILFAKGQFKLSFRSASDPIHDQVTAAEIRNTVMIAHCNAALCLADHIGPCYMQASRTHR